jgi:hypothetical protein
MDHFFRCLGRLLLAALAAILLAGNIVVLLLALTRVPTSTHTPPAAGSAGRSG